MASLQVQDEITLVNKVCEIYDKMSKLESLKPSKEVNSLFTELLVTCTQPSSINVASLPADIQEMKSKLVRIRGEIECHQEVHFASLLTYVPDPIDHLNIYPFYPIYLKLCRLEYEVLIQHCNITPKRLAFLGSGPLPLTSIVLASYHLKDTIFHNYERDSLSNSLASSLVSTDPNLSKRMVFHTTDVMDATDELKEYDVVFLAALVGITLDEKVKVISHLAKYMAPGAILMLRSVKGARAFLYAVVDLEIIQGFDVLSVSHPDDVTHTIVIARKFKEPVSIAPI